MSSVVMPENAAEWAEASTSRPGDWHVKLSAVVKRYPGQQTDALKNIHLQVRRGEIFGIIGRSGAGKSTLIRLLNRLEEPTAGQVVIDGVDLGSLTHAQLVAWRRRTGMIFQHFNLLSAKTVRENIELPMRVAGVPAAVRRQKTDTLLALVGLEARQHAYPAQLSGGQNQRVGIARALVHDPELLLCDEATSALDPETTRSILALLRKINRELHITIVLITHEMDVIHDLCQRVAVIERGEIVESGSVWQVYGNPQQETTRILLAPDRDALPEDLQRRLRPEPAAGYGPLIRLRYNGSGAMPQLNHLIAAFGSDITLLQSSLENVQGKNIGQLLLRVAQPLPQPLPAGLADHVEILGYVTAS